jgi:hypothetical protein
MRDYGKVYGTFWSSTTTHSLSDDGKLLALYLMTCSHNTIAGVFRLPDGYVSEDMGWDNARVQQGFLELLSKGFANRCATTKWVWVVKHLEWNKPENPNQRKSAAKIAQSVPTDCAWKVDFIQECGVELGITQAAQPNPSETVAQPLLNQEQEQEQEKPSASSADKLPPCQPQAVIDLYHEALPELPGVRLMTDKRRKAIGGFWRWVLTSKKTDGSRRAQTADQALTWIRSYFERATDNDFLMGRGRRSDEHANWQCDFDFLLTEKGMKHVIEKTKEAA